MYTLSSFVSSKGYYDVSVPKIIFSDETEIISAPYTKAKVDSLISNPFSGDYNDLAHKPFTPSYFKLYLTGNMPNNFTETKQFF